MKQKPGKTRKEDKGKDEADTGDGMNCASKLRDNGPNI